MRKRSRVVTTAVTCFALALSAFGGIMGTTDVKAAQVLTNNATGTHDGYDYELWKDNGNTSMTLNNGGTFDCNWSNINNALFRTGRKFDSTKNYQQLGAINVSYDCNYNPQGNSYLCVYGWTKNPLVEYYIVDSWGTWRPPGSSPKGQITVDGGTYDVYETTRVNQPSIEGNTTFQQYWSVRTSKRTSGTISVSEHFKQWERFGMKMGNMYEVALTVEGYQSSGSAKVTKNDITIGGSGSGYVAPTSAPTSKPTSTPTSKPTSAPANPSYKTYNNLLDYSNAVGRVGTCINLSQLRDRNTLNALKEQYNSVTLENENKPDALLGNSANLISVSQAKSLGYYIPANYTESMVPRINFSTVDEALRICSQNNIGYRAHTLVWHSQTPSWWFKQGYGNGGNVSKQQMDARLEFYVKTVMKHVYSSEYGKCCYAWDIANEYFHANNSGWQQIYGGINTSPDFLKKAFTYGHEVLEELGLTDSVSLFYNDYNTYEVSDKILAMAKYINSDKKVMDGVGMQAHLDVSYPSVASFTSTLQKFLDAGLQVQITELDVTNNSESAQASYMYDLMKGVLNIVKKGGNVTGITLWGMYDSMSWRSNQSPLLYSRNTSSPKQSYYKVLQAYKDVYGTASSEDPWSGNQGSDDPWSGNQGEVVTSDSRMECENMKVEGPYAGPISSPFDGVALYGNDDKCTYTYNFTNAVNTFALRGCSNNNNMARVDLKINGQYKGTFYYGDANPATYTINNVYTGTGNQTVELVVTSDNGSWDMYADYLEIK